MLYLVTANTTLLWSISLQPILHCYDLLRTANTTLIRSISLQPILHCYDLSRYNQYYIAIIYSDTANTTLL